MDLLLDANILLGLTPHQRPKLDTRIAQLVVSGENACFASIASLWEVAIKTRLRKLDPEMPLDQFDRYLELVGIVFIPIRRDHVLADLEDEPSTRDPFDRLLLGICQVENMRLVTCDRVLSKHPLAWR